MGYPFFIEKTLFFKINSSFKSTNDKYTQMTHPWRKHSQMLDTTGHTHG